MPATWKRILTSDDVVTENLGNTNLTTNTSRSYTFTSSGALTIVSHNGSNLLKLTSGPSGLNTDVAEFNCAEVSFRNSNDANAGTILLYESANASGDSYVGLRAPTTIASDYTLTLPTADGSNGQALVTDGSGNLSFSTVSGSGTIDGTGAANKIAIWSDTDTLTNDTDLSWASSTNTLSATNVTASGTVDCKLLFADSIVIGKQPLTNAAGAYDGNGSRVFSKVGSQTTPVSPEGKIWYLQGSGSGSWLLADKDAEASSTGLLALWPNTGGPTSMVQEGVVRMASNSGFSSAAAGTPVYLGDDGAVQTAVPGTGDIARIVGYVLNASSRIIYFCPDNSYVKVT